MNAPHWIDRHFTSPQERAAAILAQEGRAARESRGRMLRLVFLLIPLLLVSVAIVGAGTAAALNYYGVVDLTAYAPQLPRKAPAPIAAPTPALVASGPGFPDHAELILAPDHGEAPQTRSIAEPIAAPESPQPVGQPISAGHAQHLRDGIAIMGRELAETDAGIAAQHAALYVRPWTSQGGRPAPWTDAEHLVELEAYWNRSRLNAGQVWEYNRAHDAWVASVTNDKRRLADLIAKRASITARRDTAKAELGQ